jgi:hypothetical protein
LRYADTSAQIPREWRIGAPFVRIRGRYIGVMVRSRPSMPRSADTSDEDW